MVKRLQMQRAFDDYFVPAAATAKKMKLHSEFGVALAFDMHVQNGASRKQAVAELAPLASQLPEPEMRQPAGQARGRAFQSGVRRRRSQPKVEHRRRAGHGAWPQLSAGGLGLG